MYSREINNLPLNCTRLANQDHVGIPNCDTRFRL
jgi:hypothetical protein